MEEPPSEREARRGVALAVGAEFVVLAIVVALRLVRGPTTAAALGPGPWLTLAMGSALASAGLIFLFRKSPSGSVVLRRGIDRRTFARMTVWFWSVLVSLPLWGGLALFIATSDIAFLVSYLAAAVLFGIPFAVFLRRMVRNSFPQ